MDIRQRRPIRFVVLVLITMVGWNVQSLCQATPNQNIAQSGSQLPRLCMPVTYREPPTTGPIRIWIGMLGDRYHEVSEALAGWNESGVPLVGRINSAWQPVPCGDDTGLFYLVPLIARETGWSADASLNFFFFGLILASALAAYAGLSLNIHGARRRLFSLIPVMAGAWLSYKVGDVYAVQAALVLAVIPWLVYAIKMQASLHRRLLIAFVAGIFLGFGQWIRTQSATGPLIFFAVLLCFSPLRRPIRILLGVTVILGLSLPLLYARLPLWERDRFLARNNLAYQPPINHHLVWHTTYLGLAYLTNPYVPAWRDAVAVEYVESIDPSAIYGGKEYEALLHARVKEIARQDRRLIFYTVAAKTGVLLWMLVLSINIGLVAAVMRPKPMGTEVAFWLAMASAALPGVIAIPSPEYVIGMILFGLYYCYYSVLFYVDIGPRSSWTARTGLRGVSTGTKFEKRVVI